MSAPPPIAAEWLDSSPLLSAIHLGPQGAIRRVNATAARLLGYDARDLEGGHLESLVGSEPAPGARTWNLEVARTGRRLAFDVHRLPEGETLLVGAETTPSRRIEDSMRRFVEVVGPATGASFFQLLVEHVARSLGAPIAFIGELRVAQNEIQTVAMWHRGEWAPNVRYRLDGTPCESVVSGGICVYPRGVQARFPRDLFLAEHGIETYVGTPLVEADGEPVGILSVLYTKPTEEPESVATALQIFAARAAGELARKRREDALRAREDELLQRNHMLLRLAGNQAIEHGDLERGLREITEAAAQALGVQRGSVWLFEDGDARLACRDVFSAASGEHSSGGVLLAAECPRYLAALREHRCVAAPDCASDERTREFAGSYFAIHDVRSTLDAPIRIGGRVVGVLCVEAIGTRRAWTKEEEQFAASLADLAAISMEAMHLREAQVDLLQKHLELGLLHRLSEIAETSDAPDQATPAMLAEIARALGYERAVLEVASKGRRTLSVRCAHGFEVPPPAAFGSEVLGSTEARAFVASESLDGRLRARLAELGLGAALAVPLQVDRGAIGALSLGRATARGFDARELGVAVRAASALAQHLDRQRAHEEQARLQEQLIQAQKLEAVGTLAGGVAHDFNNLLTGILGYAYLLRQGATEGDEVDQAARAIGQAAERAAELTQQLLGFARKGKHKSVPVDMHVVIRDVRELCARTFPKSIATSVAPDAARAIVMGDPGQMHQVLLNLAINARDAISGAGKISFATRSVAALELPRAEHPALADAPHVAVEVTDTGSGIAPEHMPRIFEPFFTTKETGKGTGMGLAMVYGIVSAHGGAIEVETELGRGTTFRLYLPLAGEGASAVQAPRPALPVRGTARVLVVDDEPLVADMASEFLRSLGYSVAVAESGSQAIEKFLSARPAFDVVLLDLVMPRMGGRECLRALKRLEPGARVVLSSGYQLEGGVEEALAQGAVGFVHKPFAISALSEAIARALAGEGAAPRQVLG